MRQTTPAWREDMLELIRKWWARQRSGNMAVETYPSRGALLTAHEWQRLAGHGIMRTQCGSRLSSERRPSAP